MFEDAGLDFLAIHPRTVQQKYDGRANHDITAELAQRASFPVIANGDIKDADAAQRVLEHTGAAGLMLGRGAVADPLLFERIRGRLGPVDSGQSRVQEITHFMRELLLRYSAMFCGETQVLAKMKESIRYLDSPGLDPWLKSLRRAKKVDQFSQLVEAGP